MFTDAFSTQAATPVLTGVAWGVPTARFTAWRAGFVVALLLTLVALLLPAAAVLALKIWIVSWWPEAQALARAEASQYADKWLHGSLFALLGLLGMAAWRQCGQRRWLWLGLLLLAPVTELLQHWVPGRAADAADAAADMLGLVLGGLLAWLATGAAPLQAQKISEP